MKSKLESAVDKGEVWLDENIPGWWEKVDLRKLDMSNGCKCVLGQVEEDYSVSRHSHNLSTQRCCSMGLILYPRFSLDYPALTAEWKKRIKARRKVK